MSVDPAGLEADLHRAADELADLHGTHRQAGELLEADARRRAPRRRTGELDRSIGATVGEQGLTVTAAADHAWPLHSGVPSRGIAAHPFLTDALAAQGSDVIDLYLTHVDDVLDILKG